MVGYSCCRTRADVFLSSVVSNKRWSLRLISTVVQNWLQFLQCYLLTDREVTQRCHTVVDRCGGCSLVFNRSLTDWSSGRLQQGVLETVTSEPVGVPRRGAAPELRLASQPRSNVTCRHRATSLDSTVMQVKHLDHASLTPTSFTPVLIYHFICTPLDRLLHIYAIAYRTHIVYTVSTKSKPNVLCHNFKICSPISVKFGT